MKILITGGAGYIGSVLVPKLLSNGYEVTVLDNFMFRPNSLADACKFKNFSVERGDARDEILMKKCCNSTSCTCWCATMQIRSLCDFISQSTIYRIDLSP